MKTDSKTPKDLNILVKINGEDKQLPLNLSIVKLLEIYKINKDRVVIELNKEILKKDQFQNISLNQNDSLEIVTFVGGG